tara:strand:+ start:67 stop:825 length:759 start_codon:yes stop_codon:yes gene_type:complete
VSGEDSDLELVEEEERADDSSEEVAFDELGAQYPTGPPPPPPVGPLRTYDEHRVPDTTKEIFARALVLGGLSPVLLVYFPLAAIPLFVKHTPTGEVLAWPGMAGCTFVMTFALLERARTVFQDEDNLDPLAIPGLLFRVLVFFFPLMLGVGSMPSTAWLVIPPMILLLPLVLGALGTDVWGEITPPGLWNALRVTPNYGTTIVLNALVLGIGLGAVWGFPEGAAIPRAAAGLVAAGFAGALAGAARRDAELG